MIIITWFYKNYCIFEIIFIKIVFNRIFMVGTNVGIQFKDGTYGNCSFARQKTEGKCLNL